MPRLEASQKVRIGVAAAAISASVVGVYLTRDYDARVNAVILDAGLSRETGSERMTDLLGPEIPPGQYGSTMVVFPDGFVVDEVSLADGLELLGQHDTPRGEHVITARNATDATMRLVGFITFKEVARDAGVDAPVRNIQR